MTLVGEDLPGLSCGGGPGFPGYRNIHVAVQRRGRPGELLGLTPGDAPRAAWTLECVAKAARDGGTELTGPYVQGGPGGRFVYLSWGTVGDDGGFTLFRRAKLMLGAIAPGVLTEAVRGGRLTGRLGLTDAKGHPTCARVVPPAVRWSAG
ncbi:DUF5990 family protein [Actinacidiphila rubida]|uniref:Monooxygenase n=1 Tax=Actinacidiphila rubida TaxID=310780 RepID=A0A1H8NB25_9ACTN|nr:DUF5990 family protein [Actinacidiphila rubida]SEO26633.1 hypothetical protein SAMN05216267_1021118 [Actinacidiphila rubida]